MNAKMPALKRCLEEAGFTAVKTVLASGNVVFRTRAAAAASAWPAVARRCERAMTTGLDRSFLTIVRSLDALDQMLADDPFARFRLGPKDKRVVTFLHEATAPTRLKLPLEFEDARILAVADDAIFSTYVPGPRGGAFMAVIEKTFGKAVTTRTWETVQKVARTRPAKN
jgi:uncharacterized protein (DUF1697 family)